ncbi:MAG: tyrosine-protein kinase family protein [Gemmatimonadales bacterium]|nr:MAG: tyrosine-protein kinase family protein [Gemmatimonadales bacterium]
MASESAIVLSFDPESPVLPDPLHELTDPRVQVVVLLADPATRESGWAPSAAAGLARGLGELGRRVLLLDADVADPTLHEVLGGPNGEGVTDAVLFGVSPERVSREQEGGFLFAPAGTVVADPPSVLRHPRWGAVLSQCRDSGLLVLLYLPAGAPGTEGLAGEADRSIRLKSALSAGVDQGQGGFVLHPERAGVAGSGAVPAPVTPAAADPEAEPDVPGLSVPMESEAAEAAEVAQWSPPVEDTDAGGGDAGGAIPAGRGGAAGSVQATDPQPSPSTPSDAAPESRTLFWFLIFLIVVALGLVVGALFGVLEIPGITPVAGDSALLLDDLLRSP